MEELILLKEEYSRINAGVKKKLGEKRTNRSKDEGVILERLKYFYKGYKERNLSEVEKWVKKILDEKVQIIGTNSVYPESFEWRTGHPAAIEMFGNDWKNWGKLEMYLDHAEIDVAEQAAWSTIFATVARFTPEEENRTFEASRKRSLQRIKAIAESEKHTSIQAIYQIINDASSVLHQYEQSELFVWPIRISLGLTKKNEKWLIKQIHFSWPGRGFPAVRLLEE